METKQTNQDVVRAQWIAPGISFKNPDISTIATVGRRTPWFMENSIAMMPSMKHEGPMLDIQKPKWRRMYKNRNLVRLDRSYRELPSFGEVGFGSLRDVAPSVPSSDRGMWGNLESVLMAAGSIWQQKEQLKANQKIAEEQIRLQSVLPFELSTTAMVGIAVGASILGYIILSRR